MYKKKTAHEILLSGYELMIYVYNACPLLYTVPFNKLACLVFS